LLNPSPSVPNLSLTSHPLRNKPPNHVTLPPVGLGRRPAQTRGRPPASPVPHRHSSPRAQSARGRGVAAKKMERAGATGKLIFYGGHGTSVLVCVCVCVGGGGGGGCSVSIKHPEHKCAHPTLSTLFHKCQHSDLLNDDDTKSHKATQAMLTKPCHMIHTNTAADKTHASVRQNCRCTAKALPQVCTCLMPTHLMATSPPHHIPRPLPPPRQQVCHHSPPPSCKRLEETLVVQNIQ
jgi:hypothetical protein